MHPSFLPTAEQTAKLADLRARLEAAITAHQDKPWQVRRARQILTYVKRTVSTQDRRICGQFLHEWELGIEAELRLLAGASVQQVAA